MKNEFSLFLLALSLVVCVTCVAAKDEHAKMDTLTLQLKGVKYDQLFFKTLVSDLSHRTIVKNYAGQSPDGYLWTFYIPDSINKMVDNYTIITRPFDFKSKTVHRAFFAKDENDTVNLYNYVYDKKNPYLEVTYLKTKQPYLTDSDLWCAVNDTLLVQGFNSVEDIFKVNFKEKDSELELSMRYKGFGFLDNDNYEKAIAEKDSIFRKYPDSRYLMRCFYQMVNKFKSIKDLQRIYNDFSEENKLTWYGQECNNYIKNFRKLYTSDFENISLPNAKTEKLEPIILNSAKYNLVIFSASWCGACHNLIPYLKDIHNDLKGNLDMVYVSLDEASTVAKWKNLLKEKAIPWRSLLAESCVKEVAEKYDAEGIPQMLLVYPDKSVKKIDIRHKEDKEMFYRLVQKQGQ